MPQWLEDAFESKKVYFKDNSVLTIETLEGNHTVSDGDWIIRGVKGELYPCKPDIFEATYTAGEGFKADKDTSDGYHTFRELYDYRMAYNAMLFNEWAERGLFNVHRSWKHHDGEDCFAGGKDKWFIVVAQLPTGQISNHYKAQYWPLFNNVIEVAKADPWDGHTPQQALERMLNFALMEKTAGAAQFKATPHEE